jgi:hypothetical protein
MDDTSFAALILTILHKEGRLEGNLQPNTLENWLHDCGADIPTILGFYDGTTGIANIRPSVALEILNEGYTVRGSITEGFEPIPSPDGTPPVTQFQVAANELQDEEKSIEYLAANLRRGADRVRSLGYESSAFNLAAYHNRGIQTGQYDAIAPDGTSIGYEAVVYGYNIVQMIPELLVFVAEVPGANYGGYYLDYNSSDLLAVQQKLGVEK